MRTISRVAGLVFIKGVFKLLPAAWALKTGCFLGRLAYLLFPYRRTVAIENLRRAFPDKSAFSIRETARSAFENTGINLAYLMRLSSVRDINNDFAGDQSRAESVLLAWHPIHYGILKASVKEDRCFLASPGSENGLPVSFFGRPVNFSREVAALFRGSGRGAVPVSGVWKNGFFSLKSEKPLTFISADDPLKSDFINTQAQACWVEKKIREKPGEWVWMRGFRDAPWPAVFLDRDGTLNADYGYVSDYDKFDLLPGVSEAMRRMRGAGYLIVIVTNQSGVARGYYTSADFRKLTGRMLDSFLSEGVIVDRVYSCFHHPDDGCACRKPAPGMGIRAMKELNIDLSRSFMVGDKPSDVEFGENLGMKTILVMTGEGEKSRPVCGPGYTARDLSEAASIITANE